MSDSTEIPTCHRCGREMHYHESAAAWICPNDLRRWKENTEKQILEIRKSERLTGDDLKVRINE